MKIEDYKRINGWLNIRVNPIDNQNLYDFSEFMDGIHHSLSEAEKLYNQYIKNQPERTNPEAPHIIISHPIPDEVKKMFGRCDVPNLAEMSRECQK